MVGAGLSLSPRPRGVPRSWEWTLERGGVRGREDVDMMGGGTALPRRCYRREGIIGIVSSIIRPQSGSKHSHAGTDLYASGVDWVGGMEAEILRPWRRFLCSGLSLPTTSLASSRCSEVTRLRYIALGPNILSYLAADDLCAAAKTYGHRYHVIQSHPRSQQRNIGRESEDDFGIHRYKLYNQILFRYTLGLSRQSS